METLWQTTGGTALVKAKYGRNQVGGIVWRQDLAAAALGVNTQDNYYWYDGLQQVTAHQRGLLSGTAPNYTGIIGPPQQEEDFGYDATGNWATYDTLVPTNSQSRSHNQANEITEIGNSSIFDTPPVGYDLAGNMTLGPQTDTWADDYEMVYDAWNRLVKVVSISDSPTSSSSSSMEDSSSSSSEPSSVTVATYAYDGLTRRITKTTDDDTQNYYYSKDWQVLEAYGQDPESSSPSEVVTQWFWGLRGVDDLILRLEPDIVQPLYALRDQWNVVAVTDSSAAAQERYGYNAFGTTLFMTASFGSISESSFGWETTFCGYRLDGETGFYQVRYRYLHPTLGRWLSRDPLGELWFELTMKTLSPDGTGDRNSTRALLDEEGGFNLYSYVTNNSSNRVDQLGLAGDYMPPYPGPRSAPPKMPCPWRDCWKNCMMQNGANWALGVLGASTLGGGTIPKLITAGMPQGGITNTWSAASLILKKLGVLPLNNPVLRNIGDEVNPALTAAQVAALSFLIGLSNSCGAICSGNSSAY